MKRVITMFFVYLFAIILLCVLVVILYMQQAKFGKAPSGVRLEKMHAASNYKDGAFQNINFTPSLAEGFTMWDAAKDFLFAKYPETSPLDSMIHTKVDLKDLDPTANVMVWMGHSSYFIQLDGKKFLIDPVLSGNASPIPGSVKAFAGADIYKPEDIPVLDFLVITHDHYDHLDYTTIKALQAKISKVILPLGVGAHFEYWGFLPAQLIEHNWYESEFLGEDMTIHFTPARHFSGRTFKRNTTLWTSYVLESKGRKIFIGGDSGYDTHFKKIGQDYGPFDLAILENGQYNEKWRYIHALPSDQLQIIQDLQAKKVMTVHHAKFKLANHIWHEPIEAIYKNCTDNQICLLTPKIGEMIYFDSNQLFEKWWEGMH